jgi:hypothetical protein
MKICLKLYLLLGKMPSFLTLVLLAMSPFRELNDNVEGAIYFVDRSSLKPI